MGDVENSVQDWMRIYIYIHIYIYMYIYISSSNEDERCVFLETTCQGSCAEVLKMIWSGT